MTNMEREPSILECRGLPKHKLNQAMVYINEHLDKDVSLQAIAAHLSMSQYYFCRLFKESIGVSPYQYLMQQRMERAKQLLEQKQALIVDIALACGYSNQSTFTTAFRKAVGMSPRDYQQHFCYQSITALVPPKDNT
jgi:AraC family transcriptional regulator